MISFKAAVIQDHGYPETQVAIKKYSLGIREAAKWGAKLIVLPELHNSLHYSQVEREKVHNLAEMIQGQSTALFCTLAHELQVVLIISVFEQERALPLHHTAVVIDQNGMIAGKHHCPAPQQSDSAVAPIHTSLGKIGVLMGSALFSMTAARSYQTQGADLLVAPSAMAWHQHHADDMSKRLALDNWLKMQYHHAVSSGLPVLVCNRIGLENFANQCQHFWGSSFIAGPRGDLLSHALNHGQREVLMAGIKTRSSTIDLHSQGMPVSAVVNG